MQTYTVTVELEANSQQHAEQVVRNTVKTVGRIRVVEEDMSNI